MICRVTLRDNNAAASDLTLEFDTEVPPVFLQGIPPGDPRLENETFCAVAFRDFYNSILDPHPANVTKRVQAVEKRPSPPRPGIQGK